MADVRLALAHAVLGARLAHSHVVLERVVVVDMGRSMFVWLARGGELDALVSAISCGSRGCLCSIPPPSSVPRLGWCTRSPALSFVVSITMPWISRPSQWRRRPCARRAWAAFVCRRGGEQKPDPPPCPRCCRSRWARRTRRRSCAWPPVDHLRAGRGGGWATRIGIGVYTGLSNMNVAAGCACDTALFSSGVRSRRSAG